MPQKYPLIAAPMIFRLTELAERRMVEAITSLKRLWLIVGGIFISVSNMMYFCMNQGQSMCCLGMFDIFHTRYHTHIHRALIPFVITPKSVNRNLLYLL